MRVRAVDVAPTAAGTAVSDSRSRRACSAARVAAPVRRCVRWSASICAWILLLLFEQFALLGIEGAALGFAGLRFLELG